MVSFLYKHRWPVAIIFLSFLFMPFLISQYNSSPRPEITYGQYMQWRDVDEIFPRYAVATVADLDTGLEFGVQRRGGSYHADAQPLTAEDTEVMKKIYNGKWSWKRRAVTIQLRNGKKIAASMNGMPHGQGAIKRNNFNGHFCIHFADSRTHGSKKVDLAHQIMIWKSANVLDHKLMRLSPQETLQVFFTAINQSDKKVTTEIIASKDRACWSILQKIENIRVISVEKQENNNYKIDLRVKYRDFEHEISQSMALKLSPQDSGWKIKPQGILALEQQVFILY